MYRTCTRDVRCYSDSTNHTNEGILKILSDTVKTNISTEDRINRRLQAILNESPSSPSSRATPRSPPVAAAAGSAASGERPASASNHSHVMTSSPRKSTNGGKFSVMAMGFYC